MAKNYEPVSIPVNVIIPCYNCGSVIERAINSVMKQSRMPRRMILIDDASCDEGETLGKLHAFQKNLSHIMHVDVISLQTNQGPSAARNAGWDAATEPYIAFLDADDSWHPRKLELQYGWMKSRSELDVTGHLCIWEGLSEAGEHNQFDESSSIKQTLITKTGLLKRNAFSTPTVMLRREIALRFNEEKKHAEDYMLWLQLVCSGYHVARLETALAVLHKAPFGEAGLSADLWLMEKGVQDMFSRLRDDGMLTAGAFWSARLFSLVKYLRRVLISYYMIRKRRRCC